MKNYDKILADHRMT